MTSILKLFVAAPQIDQPDVIIKTEVKPYLSRVGSESKNDLSTGEDPSFEEESKTCK